MEYDVDRWDMEEFDYSVLNNKNERDVEMAREYCDEHEFYYKNHTCEPTWEDNGDLDKYIVLLHKNQKERDSFVKKRNKKMNHVPKKFKRKD
jgi:hypothetical protein|tara:strand:+ start:203 stop:478 length:276 start_codon:yes stop_codon:yes gene_type:complete